MAERRMFAKTIIDSDAFIDMPLSTQALYFHLSMRADDDGFINNPKKIQKMVGCGDDDLKLLIAKKFIIPFESGIVVIKHWKIHNYIRNDRYKPTVYLEEKSMLDVKDNNGYTLKDNLGIPNGYQMDTQYSIGKDSIDIICGHDDVQIKEKPKHFTKPTLEEVQQYCSERNNNVNPNKWLDYYESNGWKVGKNPMKDWKACVRTWENSNYSNETKKTNNLPEFN